MYQLLHLIKKQIVSPIKSDNSLQGQMFFLGLLVLVYGTGIHSSVKSAGEEDERKERDLCKPAS